MKFPKKVLIGGVYYKIEFSKKVSGGDFWWHKHLIRVEKGMSQERQFSILLHEICEAILVDNFMRYQKCIDATMHNGDYIFIFKHDAFEIFTSTLAGVLKEFI